MRRARIVLHLLPLIALLAGLAGAAAARDGVPEGAAPMTAEAFEAMTTGRTMTYGIGGEPYGIERYMAGRRVIWAFLGGECREGRWFEDEDRICFVYDDAPGELHCWRFFEAESGLMARLAGEEGDVGAVVEVKESPEPMHCPGPRVGV